MQKYNHLDLQDRHKINALLQAGHSQTKIAEIIGVHKSTISRELSRNRAIRGRYANEYRPEAAQRKTNQCHHSKPKHTRFTEDLKQDAIQWLTTEKLSPELISGRWIVQGVDGVSHEAIYHRVRICETYPPNVLKRSNATLTIDLFENLITFRQFNKP